MRATKPKPVSATIAKWLRENGMRLGGLTGQDWPALKSAVHIVELWCSADFEGRAHAERAFGSVVWAMQPNLRYLAYHAIAHVGDWSKRDQLWTLAHLEPLADIPRCTHDHTP